MQSRYADLLNNVTHFYLIFYIVEWNAEKNFSYLIIILFATLTLPCPCFRNWLWLACKDYNDLIGKDPLLIGGSINLELGIRTTGNCGDLFTCM